MRNKKRDKFGDRRDGVWIKETDPMHAFVPYLYPCLLYTSDAADDS